MELDQLLVCIIDTPEFQRLRNIKQTGVANYVYPGATHNRFEHCIGVSYLAGQIIDKLSTHIEITRVDKLCVQIAGLIHDIGHGPFSHMFHDSFLSQMSADNWSHELQSCRIFDHIVKKHDKVRKALKAEGIGEVDLVFIKELINSQDYSHNEGWPFKARSKEKSFLYEIVANERTGIDVDKFDYLMRDCYYFGVNCTLDWRRMAHMMRIVEKDGQLRIAIRDKEKDNVFNMFYLRMHLRRIAYQHSTCNAIDAMIADVLKLCNDVIFPDILLSDSIHHMDRYLSLSDHILDTIAFMPHCNRSPHHLQQAKDLIDRIRTRRLYTLLAETPPSNRNFKKTNEILQEIVGEDKELTQNLAVIKLQLNFGKWGPNGDPLESILFYDKDGVVMSEKQYNESSMFVPRSWCQKQLRMFCKSEDIQIINRAKRKCDQWISQTDFAS